MKKVLIGFLSLIIVILIGLLVYKLVWSNEKVTTIEVKDTIEEYGYTLDDRDHSIFKSTFNDLKKVLNSEEIDYKEYATLLSKLFIIDLYTLNNKTNKYDIGSTEYVHESILENYKENVKDTLYKYINDKSIKDSELPEVKSVSVINIEEQEFEINEESYEAYNIELNWEYEKDLEYDKEGYLIIIKEDNKLYVVEKGLLGV